MMVEAQEGVPCLGSTVAAVGETFKNQWLCQKLLESTWPRNVPQELEQCTHGPGNLAPTSRKVPEYQIFEVSGSKTLP